MTRIKQLLLNSLIFIRLVDSHDKLLSITNIAMYVVLVKMAITGSTSINDCGSLLLAFSQYGFKKYLNKDVALSSLSSIKNVIGTIKDVQANAALQEENTNA